MRRTVRRWSVGVFLVVVATTHIARADTPDSFPSLTVPTHWANENGPITVGKQKVHSNIDVYYPRVDAELPVLVVVGGLNGVLPTVAYNGFYKSIASRGVIVVAANGRWLLANQYRERAEEMARAIDWLPDGLPALLALRSGGASPRPAMDTVMVMGHSSGAQAAMATYELREKQIAGVVLLDPVDGDPYRLFPQVVKKDTVYPASVKLLMLTTRLCSEPSWNVKWYPPCCPEGSSAQHFYDAFPGIKWWAHSLDYGHIDLLDDKFLFPANWMGLCKASDRKLDRDAYRAWVGHEIASFSASLAWHRPFTPNLPQTAVRYEVR